MEKLEMSVISIRAPAWGATDVRHIDITASVFQSALPRGERQIIRC